MATGNNAASQAAQIEAIRPQMAQIMLLSSILWGKMEERTDLTAVSSRPTRVPIQPITGGAFSVGQFDGQDMGTGSGPQEVTGYLSCAFYLQASQYTALSAWATDTSGKSVKDYVSLTHQQAFETFGGYMDVLVQKDGSNTIDTVVAVGTGYLQVNSANFFQSNQLVDIWTAVSGSFVTTLQIQDEDIQQNFIYMTTAIPGTVTSGMVIMAHGASGQPNVGIFGLQYYNVASNTGNFMGIPRASLPGRFTAANVNLGGSSLTPAAVRAIQGQIFNNMGGKALKEQNPVAHCGYDQVMAWENLALTTQSIIYNEMKGNESADMLKRDPASSMAGRPMLPNPRATPGRIDFIDLKNFWRLQIKAPDYYDVNGQTVFPVIGGSGGLQSQNLFYVVYGGQIGMTSSRVSGFISNAAIPKGIYGH